MFALSVTVCDIDHGIVQDLDLECVKVKCKYANGEAICDFLLAVFAQSVTICKKFAIKLCMILTLNFTMG